LEARGGREAKGREKRRDRYNCKNLCGRGDFFEKFLKRENFSCESNEED
jgi:hypothetical protein